MSSVSVIMSTYCRNKPSQYCQSNLRRATKCPNQLRRAIDSILSQTFGDLELVLIDDGSSDGTEEVCKEYARKDSRVSLTRFEKNSNLTAMRYNYGMKVAKSDYFMFMFDDDMLYPNAVEDLYKAITGKHQTCGMVYGITEWETQEGLLAKLGEVWNVAHIEKTNILANLSVIVKREVINELGGYEEHPSFKRLCDWDLWRRIGRKYEVTRISRVVGRVFLQPDGIGATVPFDHEGVMKIQKNPRRVVALKGELPRIHSAPRTVKKIVFVYSSHDAALVRWALSYLCEAIKREGVIASIVNLATTNDEQWAEGADVILVYRCFELKALHFMRRMKAQGKFLMFFLDDYLFQPGCKYAGDWKMPMEPLNESDCLISSSSVLLSKMPDKPKILRRSVVDQDTMGILNQEYRRNNQCFNIGWLCSRGRTDIMDRFVYETLRILNTKIPEGIKCAFHCFGSRNYPQFSRIEVKEHLYFKPEEWKELYTKWTEIDLSVVINPLEEEDEFCHCKSELKFVESGAMGVPLITSRVPPYNEFIREGENGFFASTPKEYAEKILQLITDEALSRKVSANCKAYVLEHCDVQKNAKKFLADMEEVMRKKKPVVVKKLVCPDILSKPMPQANPSPSPTQAHKRPNVVINSSWPNVPKKPF